MKKSAAILALVTVSFGLAGCNQPADESATETPATEEATTDASATPEATDSSASDAATEAATEEPVKNENGNPIIRNGN